MTEIQKKKTILRLEKYLDLVKSNINGTVGDLQEFWKREEKKTTTKISKI